MKRCPTCDEIYDDDLNFCLTDGTSLSDVNDSDPTVVIPSESFSSSESNSTPKGVSPLFAYLSIALLALLIGGGIVLFLKRDTANLTTSDSPSPKPTLPSNGSSTPTAKQESPSPTDLKTNSVTETKATPIATKAPDKTLNLAATRSGWTAIGRGNFVLSASGQIDFGGISASPEGVVRGGDGVKYALAPKLPFGAIIAKFGESGQPFVVGFSHNFDTEETVYVAINDSDYSDNSGSFKVRVKYE